MSGHNALLLPAKRRSLVTGNLPDAEPGSGQIVIRARAVAVNPFDRYVQAMGDLIAGYLAYPAVLGTDVAGEIIAVGAGVSRLRVGDRVLGHAAGLEKSRNSAAEGAFQERVVLLEHMVSPIPDTLTFEEAAVLPLGLSTAACALFQRDFLALAPPRNDPVPTGRTLLVWGGSTSVGSNAIQLAKAAGYEVAATCSPHNFDLVRDLGATWVFDYRSPSAVDDLATVLTGRDCAGAIAIGKGSTAACMDILARSGGRRFVAEVTPPTSFDTVQPGRGRLLRLMPALSRLALGRLALRVKARRHGFATRMVWGGSLIGNEVGPLIYEQFLPGALAKARFQVAPAPLVVGHGLHLVPEALERQRRGVSARKIVVTL